MDERNEEKKNNNNKGRIKRVKNTAATANVHVGKKERVRRRVSAYMIALAITTTRQRAAQYVDDVKNL